MKQEMSFGNKLQLQVLGASILVFGLTMFLVSSSSYKTAQKDAKAYTSQVATSYANKIQGKIEEVVTLSKVLAFKFENALNNNIKLNEQETISYLKSILKSNDYIVGAWFQNRYKEQFFKANNDSKGKNGYDKTGRFSPYVVKSGKIIKVESGTTYNERDEWIKGSKTSGKIYITRPYKYPIAGRETLMVSISSAMYHKSEFIGTVGFDISLDNFSKMVSNEKVYETGHIVLSDNFGYIIGHEDKKFLQRNTKEKDPNLTKVYEKSKQGKDHSFFQIAPYTGKRAFFYVHNFEIKGTEQKWYLLASAPEDEYLSQAYFIRDFSIISLLIGLLIISIVILLSIKKLKTNLSSISTGLNKFFKYLNKEIDKTDKITINSTDEFGVMANSINENIVKTKKLLESEKIDKLTNLPNMNAFLEDIKKCTDKNIVLFDVDEFRKINSIYGYSFSDKVLLTLANKIKKEILTCQNYNLYRYHGDLFIILETKKNDKNISMIYDRVLDLFDKEDLVVENEKLSISLTAGIAKTTDEPIKYAELAFQRAKENKTSYEIYDESITILDEYKKHQHVLKLIRVAIDQDLVLPYFQLIRDNKNPKNKKYESLMRIKDSNGKVHSPFIFLDIAKKAKLYGALSKIMMKKTIQRFEKEDASFSINLEVEDVLNKSTMNYLYELITTYKVENKIILEITESESFSDLKLINEIFKRFRDIGVQVAIDDFGIGYSNFSYLLEFEFDYIKIDGSLIKNINHDQNSFLIVQTIVSFAKKLGKKIIAEFIENEEIQKVVENLEIDYSQGYLFSKPSYEL